MTAPHHGPVCLCCGIHEVRREDVAGLCVACRIDVAWGELLVDSDAQGNVSLRPSLTSFLVLCGDPDAIYPPVPYDPGKLLLPGHTERERQEVLAELLKLTFSRPLLTLRDEAVYLIEAIRKCGVCLALNVQMGRAILDDPRRVPYPLLARFVELTEYVEDALTHEVAEEMKARRRAYDPDSETETEPEPNPETLPYGGTVFEGQLSPLQETQGQSSAGPVLELLLHSGSAGPVPVNE